MRYIVTGNTYQHQRTIKALGGEWDAARKGWIVGDKAAEWLNTPSNFGRRAIRQGTGLVITPATAATQVAGTCPHCSTYCYGDCAAS